MQCCTCEPCFGVGTSFIPNILHWLIELWCRLFGYCFHPSGCHIWISDVENQWTKSDNKSVTDSQANKKYVHVEWLIKCPGSFYFKIVMAGLLTSAQQERVLWWRQPASPDENAWLYPLQFQAEIGLKRLPVYILWIRGKLYILFHCGSRITRDGIWYTWGKWKIIGAWQVWQL